MSTIDKNVPESEDVTERSSSATAFSDLFSSKGPNKSPVDPLKLKLNRNKSLKDMGYDINRITWESNKFPPKTDLYKSVCDWFKKPESSDMTINIDNFNFKCNKIVLWTYCKYFRKNPDLVSLDISNDFMSPMEFRTLYNWMLEDKPKIFHDSLLSMLTAAIAFGIKDLKLQCWSLLSNDDMYNEENAFFMYLKARKFSLPHVRRVMLSRIKKFFLPLVSSKEFVSLNLSDLKCLMKGNSFAVNREIEIFYSLIRWLSYDWDEREPYVTQVMRLVRFNNMSCPNLLHLKHYFKSGEVNRVTYRDEIQNKIQQNLEAAVVKKSNLIYAKVMNARKFPTRSWIYDSNCEYHHKINCRNAKEVTYKMFINYLKLLQRSGSFYWHDFVSADDDNIHCCQVNDQITDESVTPTELNCSLEELSLIDTEVSSTTLTNTE
ncbi:uncharacterized protein LOC119668628 [Teleopsis dalmanni]|uniref:uncharacterized protein LOC119668628 n=1 Tax=Teleopsis dalmanni TaxID=139649 RepID=UPI0018CE53E3|nr:uncharacterized protein LOC119668628 [Teleopsis dalmanni]